MIVAVDDRDIKALSDGLARIESRLDVNQGQLNIAQTAIARMEAALTERCHTRMQTLNSIKDDHDETKERVATLERDKNKAIGMAVGAGGIAGFLAKWLMAKW